MVVIREKTEEQFRKISQNEGSNACKYGNAEVPRLIGAESANCVAGATVESKHNVHRGKVAHFTGVVRRLDGKRFGPLRIFFGFQRSVKMSSNNAANWAHFHFSFAR